MKKQPQSNYVRFIIISLTIIIIIFVATAVLAFFYSPPSKNLTNTDQPSINNSKIIPGVVSVKELEKGYFPANSSSSPVLGDSNAPITIFEYADFGCNYSARMQPILKNLLAKYNGKIKIIFKDLPSDATAPAHLAARCAQEQNKFWEYGNLLWQNQKDFSINTLTSLAKKINLDLNKFNACMTNKKAGALIDQDVKEADNLSILGTPHFYIDKQEVLGVATQDELETIIQQELK